MSRVSDVRIKLHKTGETLTGFTGFQIQRSIDAAADAFAFSVPFDPAANIQRFEPFARNEVSLFADDELLLNGYIESITAQYTAERRVLEFQGRSRSGTLVDLPASVVHNPSGAKPEFRSEYAGMRFNSITAVLCPFLSVKAIPDIGPFGSEAVANSGQSIYQFLYSLASLHNYWAVPQVDGSLLFQRVGSGTPIIDLIEGTSPLIAISATHDVTKRYRWYIMAITQWGSPLPIASASDPSIDPVTRGTKLVEEPEQSSADYTKAVTQEMNRSIMESYSVKAIVAGLKYNVGKAWRTWKAGELVRVHAPSAYIKTPATYLIRRVSLTYDETAGERTELDLILPEFFTGETRKAYPWQG